MPYIITTKHTQAIGGAQLVNVKGGATAVETRRAVATLDDAPCACHGGPRHSRCPAMATPAATRCPRFDEVCTNWSESGGTAGPLPDGTLIEVTRVDVAELYYSLSSSQRPTPVDSLPPAVGSHDRIIAAYNEAQQEVRA